MTKDERYMQIMIAANRVNAKRLRDIELDRDFKRQMFRSNRSEYMSIKYSNKQRQNKSLDIATSLS